MATEATKIPFVEAAAPSTPAASRVVIYAKSDGLMYSKDDAGAETLMSGGAGGGSVATDAIWDAKGDLAVGTGANTAQKLTVGANGTRPEAASGETTGVKWSYPPGYEFDYAQVTSATSVTATTEGTANTIVTGNAVAYDGSTVVIIEFYCPYWETPGSTNSRLALYDGSSSIGIAAVFTPSGSTERIPVHIARRITPSNASHTYSWRAYVDSGTGSVDAGAGGSGARMPAFIRITKAS